MKRRPNLLKDDRPAKIIHVEPFYLDEHEVTNEAYRRFLEATGQQPPFHWVDGEIAEGGEKHPVVNVNWQEAAPTASRWETPSNGGPNGNGRRAGMPKAQSFHGGRRNRQGPAAHFNVLDGTRAVCRFRRIGSGLCDMAGNVWEWCFDRYERLYYQRSPEKNPSGPDEGMYRVLRGGSWADAAKYLTCANRSFARPRERSPNIGFRCARISRQGGNYR